jgi:hypothetical protein
MRKYVKPILRIAAAAGVVPALLVIVLFLAPLLINLEPIKEKTVADISRAIGGRLETRHMDLYFFPRPCITIRTGSISVPEAISGTFESLSIYPEITMLLRGKVRIARITLERPDMQMSLPEDLEKMGLKQFSLKAIDDGLATVVAMVASKAPGLLVSIKKGNLTFLKRNRSAFWFRDIDGRASLHGKRLRIAVGCNSNVWENASLAVWLKPGGFEGEGRLQLTRLRPDLIAQSLFPLMQPRIEDSEINVSLSFGADGVKLVHAELQSDVPKSTLRKGRQILTLKKVRLKAALRRHGSNTTVSLTSLDSLYPQVAMSGDLSADPASSQASLKLHSSEVDVESLGKTALFLADRVPLVQAVFEILKKGRVSGLNLTSHGKTIHDLAKEENIVIRGSITGGNILLREHRLDLKAVKGIATISHGILEGENIEARLGSARGTKGLLRLDLKGEPTRFRLDIAVSADLAELPCYLRDMVEDQAFLTELELIKDVRGDASGRLVLDRRANGTVVNADVQAFSLHALYQRFPYPLNIRGKFSYDGSMGTIILDGVSGEAGKSSFSQLSARVSLEKEPYLGVTSAAGTIVLDEIYPWLSSFESMKSSLERFGSMKGVVRLDALHAKGPLARPAMWQFQTKGREENITVAARGFPGTVEVRTGSFEAGPEQLSLLSLETRFQDSSLTISGVLNHYLKGPDRVDLLFEGEIGEESVRRMSDFINLPRELRIRSPFSLSRSHVLWEKSGKTSFSGTLGVKHGPAVSFDVLSEGGELLVKQLVIRDARSDASLSFHHEGREFDLTFNGTLTGATVDDLLEKNAFLTGWIKGNLSTRIVLDQPFNSVAHGTLQGAGLDYPWSGEGPIQVATFSLNARDNLFTIDSNLLVQGHNLRAKGKVDFLRDGFVFDMDVIMRGLDLDQIIPMLGEKGDAVFPALPLKGILRVESEYVKYGQFTWRPVQANITFGPKSISIGITKADLCNIDTPGVLEFSSKGLEFRSRPRAANQDLAATLVCLSDFKDVVSGHFSFNGEVSGEGKAEAAANSLKGTLAFEAKNGRIDRHVLLAKLLEVLSPVGVLKISDLSKRGFSYQLIRADGNLQDGKIFIKEALMDSSATDFVFNGEIDLINRRIDAVVLVVPFRTIDRIIDFIPLVRYVLAGRLVAIPVKITGDLDDPEVTPFAPSAIGTTLLDTMKRIFHLPLKLIQPLRSL